MTVIIASPPSHFREPALRSQQRGELRNTDRTHHIAMPIEGFYSGKQLLVIAERDEDLSMVPYGLLQY
jgi:hypothetical protein